MDKAGRSSKKASPAREDGTSAARGLRGWLARGLSSASGRIGLGFTLLALYLLASILLSITWPSGWTFLTGPGMFLARTFSWASFYIPLWCLLGAMIAVLRGFHPRLSYFLAASSLPFLVVAGYARISTEPGAFFENFPVFAAVGLSSLYAGLGFLFAVTLGLVLFGHVKLTQWLRSRGYLPDPRALRAARKAEKSAEQKKSVIARMHAALKQWAEDRRQKRSQAEIRLRAARSLADQNISIDLPDLPPINGQAVQERPTTSVTATAAAAAAVPLQSRAQPPASSSFAEEDGDGDMEGIDEFNDEDPLDYRPPTAARAKAPEPARAAAHRPSPGSDPLATIEFTSVPPQSVAGGGGAAGAAAKDAEDAEKKALVQRILDRRKAAAYAVPVDGILNTYPDGQYWIIDDKTRRNAEVLRETLAEFKIEAEVTGIRKGPVITMYEILPAHGVKISRITNLADNIALRLAASSVRIVAPIPGKHAVGIEVPNERRAIVSLREIIEHEAFKTAKMEIPVALGKDISGEVQFSDLTQTPHLLIAGATGSGKSVCVNAIILSILYRRTPEEVKLILIDPKIVELKLYNDIPHLLTPVVTESKRAFQALQYCICEMERRYSILDKAGVRDVKSYNRRVKERGLAQEKLPYIVVIVDEFADLMATTGKELEATLARLAAMSRAVGIHLVLATQRPSVDVITGLIKANIPSRIAFMVASKFDSRIIIDMVGAEKLLGRGDMLYSGAQDPFPVRMQGAFVSEEEVERAVAHVKTLGDPEYIDDEIFYDDEEENLEPGLFDDGDGDPLFEKALEIVLQQGKASASYIQRRLKIGYNRSARLVELMEERGIVGPAQGSKPRDILRNPEVLGHGDAGRSPSPSSHADPD